MNGPVLLRGAREIARHLGITAAEANHLHQMHCIPSFRVGGTPFATMAALDDWQELRRAGMLGLIKKGRR